MAGCNAAARRSLLSSDGADASGPPARGDRPGGHARGEERARQSDAECVNEQPVCQRDG
jgi:hypothetical protein